MLGRVTLLPFILLSFSIKADVTYVNSDLHDCLFPQTKKMCVENLTERSYPVRNPDTGKLYEGCYDKKWNRGPSGGAGEIPGGGKCTNASYPIRVEVKYFTQCSGARTTGLGLLTNGCPAGETCCISDARVIVRPKIFGDNGDVISLKLTGSKSDTISGGLDPIILNPEGSGDAAFDACRAMKEMGYNWDPVNRTCQIDPSRQCQRLGFVWENDRCINKCDGSLCTKKYCSGYVYQPDGYTCVCIGNSTTVDVNNAPCVETTATPTATPTTCTAFLTIVNAEKGQTVTGTYTEDTIAKIISAGGGKNRTVQTDCTKSITPITLNFSNEIPPMCVQCGSSLPTCGFYKGSASTATCTAPVLTDTGNYYIFTYAQGSTPNPTPTVTAAPTTVVINSATSTPSVAYQDIAISSLTVTYSTGSRAAPRASVPVASATNILSGIDSATANVCLTNTATINSSLPATVNITFSGPLSGCTIAPNQTIPVGGAPTCFSATCILNAPPGKQCARVFADYKNGEDSNSTNNTKGTIIQVYPDSGKTLTAAETNQCQ